MTQIIAILVALLIAAIGFTLFAFTSGLAAFGWFVFGTLGVIVMIACLLPGSGG